MSSAPSPPPPPPPAPPPTGLLERLLWTGLGLVLVAVVVAGARQLVWRPEPLPVLGRVPGFQLVERSGRPVSEADLRGQVWVADFIFTRCTGVCPVLSAGMTRLKEGLAGRKGAPVKLVSFSVDPLHDTPEVLRAYAERYGVKDDGWLFLTGDRAVVHRVVRDGFQLAVAEPAPGVVPPPGELVTHSDRFVLVDRALRIRGYYHGTEADAPERVLADLERLRGE